MLTVYNIYCMLRNALKGEKMKNVSTNNKIIDKLYIVAAFIIILLYAWNSMVGFRWPSIYVMTNHIVTCKFGFVPRTIVGTLLYQLIGTNLYQKEFLTVFILAIAAVFLAYIVYLIIRLVAIEKNFIALFLFLLYVLSPYTKYYLHEAGYYEQYGYILGIILIAIALHANWKATAIWSAILSMIAVLISETNLFLIIPFMFTIPFLQIVEEKTHWFRRIIALGCMYIPIVFYSLLISLYLVPEWVMYKNIAEHQACANFVPREDVYWYWVFDRSNEEEWGRVLHEISPVWIIYPMLIIAVTAFLLWKQDRWLSIMYAIMSIGCGVATYLIVIVAWDLDRYYFCIFLQIFMVTIFVLRKWLKNYALSKIDLAVILTAFVISMSLVHYRFYLFDYARYLNTWEDMIQYFSASI